MNGSEVKSTPVAVLSSLQIPEELQATCWDTGLQGNAEYWFPWQTCGWTMTKAKTQFGQLPAFPV